MTDDISQMAKKAPSERSKIGESMGLSGNLLVIGDGPACISCGQTGDGGYITTGAGREGVGPFCGGCWDALREELGDAEAHAAREAQRREMREQFQIRRDEAKKAAYADAEHQGWVKRGRLKLDVDPQYRAEIETWEEAVAVVDALDPETEGTYG